MRAGILLCHVAQSTTGETAFALTSFSGTLFRVLEYYILGTCCCRDDFPCLGMKQRNRQILSAVRFLTKTCPGSRRSRQRSALAWVYAGEHGPCGGLRVPTPSTASEKARAGDRIFPAHLGRRAGDRPSAVGAVVGDRLFASVGGIAMGS
jgi:hypothetical protein